MNYQIVRMRIKYYLHLQFYAKEEHGGDKKTISYKVLYTVISFCLPYNRFYFIMNFLTKSNRNLS